jgi:hypothetical protein
VIIAAMSGVAILFAASNPPAQLSGDEAVRHFIASFEPYTISNQFEQAEVPKRLEKKMAAHLLEGTEFWISVPCEKIPVPTVGFGMCNILSKYPPLKTDVLARFAVGHMSQQGLFGDPFGNGKVPADASAPAGHKFINWSICKSQSEYVFCGGAYYPLPRLNSGYSVNFVARAGKVKMISINSQQDNFVAGLIAMASNPQNWIEKKPNG